MDDKGTNNRSVRRTEDRIRRTFLELMREKPYQQITVSELINRADICRSTFYAHHTDIYDLLEQVEDEIVGVVASELSKLVGRPYVDGEHPIITSLFSIMDDFSDWFDVLLGKNGDISFPIKCETEINRITDAIWKEKFGGRLPIQFRDFCRNFLTYGALNSYNYQLKQRLNLPPEAMGFIVGEASAMMEQVLITMTKFWG